MAFAQWRHTTKPDWLYSCTMAILQVQNQQAKSRTFPGADINSDYNLFMIRMKLKLKKKNLRNHGPRLKFNLEKPRDPQVADLFEATIGCKFAARVGGRHMQSHREHPWSTYWYCIWNQEEEETIVTNEASRKERMALWQCKTTVKSIKKSEQEWSGQKKTASQTNVSGIRTGPVGRLSTVWNFGLGDNRQRKSLLKLRRANFYRKIKPSTNAGRNTAN